MSRVSLRLIQLFFVVVVVVRGKIFGRRISSGSETLPRSEGRAGSSPRSASPRHVLFNRGLRRKRRGGISRQKVLEQLESGFQHRRGSSLRSATDEEGTVLGRARISAGQQIKPGEERTPCFQSLGRVPLRAGRPGAGAQPCWGLRETRGWREGAAQEKVCISQSLVGHHPHADLECSSVALPFVGLFPPPLAPGGGPPGRQLP